MENVGCGMWLCAVRVTQYKHSFKSFNEPNTNWFVAATFALWSLATRSRVFSFPSSVFLFPFPFSFYNFQYLFISLSLAIGVEIFSIISRYFHCNLFTRSISIYIYLLRYQIAIWPVALTHIEMMMMMMIYWATWNRWIWLWF